MSAWKRLAEALGIEDPNQQQQPPMRPSAFDARRIQKMTDPGPTGMSQRPGAAAPQRNMAAQQPMGGYGQPPRPAPKSPLATAPNSPQRIGQDVDVRAAGMEEEEDDLY